MRVFPTEFLVDRLTIGLNMAWRVAPLKYGITIGPHLNIPEFLDGELPHPEITWITKRAKAKQVLRPDQFAHADSSFYTFDMAGRPNRAPPNEPSDEGRVLDWVRRPTGDNLYQWSSISQTAVNLAANMGARNIILVGCDNSSLLDNHHAHVQHTKWVGAAPSYRYDQYYEGLVEVRSALRERGVNLLSLNPFVKLDNPSRDFSFLCDELSVPSLLSGEDIPDVHAWQARPSRLERRIQTARFAAARYIERRRKGA
ncbi:MAG TPA: hypothetical protein VMM60_14580 [Ilumatobacter sp.]|nr:hypothetical protein [Ilumatobacter sp.]